MAETSLPSLLLAPISISFSLSHLLCLFFEWLYSEVYDLLNEINNKNILKPFTYSLRVGYSV